MKYRLDSPQDPAAHELLQAALEDRGWSRTDDDDWDLLWSLDIPKREVYRSRQPGQLINHFPGSVTLHYKDELAHFLELAGEENIHPRTFSLPREYADWRSFAAERPGTVWIEKEKRLCGGVGARLTRDPRSVDADADIIVQRYIEDPLLLPGHPFKHTLRVYVMITSLEPLVAFAHPEGPVKFTSRPYGTTDADLDDLVIHLTNPPVQRTNTSVEEPVRSIDVSTYLSRLKAACVDGPALMDRIRDRIARTLCAHAAAMARVSRYAVSSLDDCFELLGFDMLIDADHQPWVIECNMSPALAVRGIVGSPAADAQRRVKATVVHDVVSLATEGDPGDFERLDIPTTSQPRMT